MSHVYVVDDDRGIVDFYSSVLALDGFNVVVGYNEKDALEYLRSNKPSCVVSDCKMERIDSGLVVLTHIESNGLAGKCGFVMATSGAEQYVFETVKRYGGEVLIKPVDPAELVRAVRNQISLRQQQ